MTTQDPLELSFVELASLIRDKDASGMTLDNYIKSLQEKMAELQRQLDIAEAARNLCSATKSRKPRADKGKPRKPTPLPGEVPTTSPPTEAAAEKTDEANEDEIMF